jgi:hypothetical protein
LPGRERLAQGSFDFVDVGSAAEYHHPRLPKSRYFNPVLQIVQQSPLFGERRVMISHYLKRRYPVRVMHLRIDHRVGRSIIETLDWHAQDPLHDLAGPSLIASLVWPPSFHEATP